jgi:peroxiredoxin Q/BCP
MLKPGDAIPDFSLAASDGRTISAAALRGQRYVLYFYPKDDTPGCTREACSFRDNLPAFGKLSVPVFGVSADTDAAHQKFVRKYTLNFPLLADPDRLLVEAVGAWVEKSMYGRKYFGIARSTFVVGADGRIETVWEKVSPDGHAEDVLRALGGGGAAAQPVAKEIVAKVVVATKPFAKKVVAKKPVAKKATAKKSVMKQVPAKKAVAKKSVAKKVPAKKAAAKKSPKTKAVARKAPRKSKR